MSDKQEKTIPTLMLQVTDRQTMHVHLEMVDIPSLDYALAMLDAIRRSLIDQQTFAREQEMAQRMMQAAADEQLKQSLVGRNAVPFRKQ